MPACNHVRDGIAAAAADAEHLDYRALIFGICEYKHC